MDDQKFLGLCIEIFVFIYTKYELPENRAGGGGILNYRGGERKRKFDILYFTLFAKMQIISSITYMEVLQSSQPYTTYQNLIKHQVFCWL